MHYYNEIDPGAATWLRNMIAAGLIPQGEVDQRSIVSLTRMNTRAIMREAVRKHGFTKQRQPFIEATVSNTDSTCAVAKSQITIGSRVGRLEVVELTGKSNDGHLTAACKCECGNMRIVRLTRLSADVVECGPCSKLSAAKRGGIVKRRMTRDEAAFVRVYDSYRTNAKRKGIIFILTQAECKVLMTTPCYYCGQSPSGMATDKSREGVFIYSGIDRIDNEDGYTSSNAVSCCRVCNFAKGTMTKNQFREWITRVFNHFGNQR